jgi:hypothetical protein
VFRQLDDRLTHYNPLALKLFPDPATRPRQREVLMPEKPYRWGPLPWNVAWDKFHAALLVDFTYAESFAKFVGTLRRLLVWLQTTEL